MSAFDRLQNYSAKRGLDEVSEVFNTKEPEGAFLERVHKEGYKMYFYEYISKDGSETIDEEAYNWLSDEDKQKYEKHLEFTELYHALTCQSDQLINAIAGSGKTSMLIFKIMYDIVTGSAVTLQSIPNGTQVRVVNKMWVCTFLKSGATELELALTKWQRALGYSQTANQIAFSTLDAEFKRCLNAMGVATPIGDGAKLNSLFCKAVDSCNITRSGESLTKEDYNIISSIVTYYRGRLDDKRYQHPSCADYDITPTVLDLLVRQFANLRSANGIMDFDEVQELLYKYLYVTPNKSVQDFAANRYNFIYIDEFQDTSQMQYAILKFYARGRLWINRSGDEIANTNGLYTGEETLGKIVAVGDPSQCVIEGTMVDLVVDDDTNEVESTDIDDIEVGDIVRTNRSGRVGFSTVTKKSMHDYDGYVIKVTTENGCSITATPEHKVFGKKKYDDFSGFADDYPPFLKLQICDGNNNVYDSDDGDNFFKDINDALEFYHNLQRDKIYVCSEAMLFCDDNETLDFSKPFTELSDDLGEYFSEVYEDCSYFSFMLSELNTNCSIWTCKDDKFELSKVTNIEVIKYRGYIYDISVADTLNFIADGVVSHNCIYSFKGSDANIIVNEFDSEFRPINCTLSTNWRCPSNILNPVVPSIHINSTSASQDINAHNKGGLFKVYSFTGYKNMLSQLKKDMEEDLKENLSVAILCRTNFDGMIPALALEADKRFDFGISGENMTLNSPLPRKLLGVSSLFTERSTPAVKNALSYFVPYGGGYQVKQLIDTLKMNNMSIWQVPEADLRYSAPDVYKMVMQFKPMFMTNGVRDKKLELDALRAIYFWLMVNTFKGDSAYCESARAYLETLVYIIDENDFESVYEFIEEVEFLNDKLNARIKKSKAPIQIATVHEFKGKERDSIYIWNDSVGVFPSSKCDTENQEQLEEERRVHYIACTRAKKKEHIYTLRDKVGMFVAEMDCSIESPIDIGVSLSKKEKA